MKESKRDTLACPEAAAGTIEVLKRILLHDVESVTIRPGLSIEVSWIRRSADEDLLSGQDVDADIILKRIEMEEFEAASADAKATFMDALLFLSFRGLVANNVLVADLKEFKEAMNIPSMLTFPRFGPNRIPQISGMGILEVGPDLVPFGRYVLLAAPFTSDDPTLSVFALSVVY